MAAGTGNGKGACRRTETVRLLAEDVALLARLSELPDAMPFAARAHAALQGLRERDLERMRAVMRQELQRWAGGLN